MVTESIITAWLISLAQPQQSQGFANPPTRITASLSNEYFHSSRSFYVPPYGMVRPSIIMSARSRDYVNDEYDEDEVGNYWINPSKSLDRFPSSSVDAARSRRGASGKKSYNGFRKEDEVTVSGGRAGSPRRDTSGDWWETKRFPEDDHYYDDDYDDEYGEYGMPPPTRSRSSFRTGAPPPPRPVKDFYNKLFWFGFDPSTTRPSDRTMFGGTRGKFNAMELLRDRELRQQQQQGRRGDMQLTGGRRSLRGKRAYDPAVQDFGDVTEWNARKMGTSPAGGKKVGDDAVVEHMEDIADFNQAMRNLPPGEERVPFMDAEYDPDMMDKERERYYGDDEYWDADLPPPPVESRGSSYNYEDDDDDFDFELERPRRRERRGAMDRRRGRRSDRERQRGWDLFPLPESKRSQAEAYDRFIGLGPRPGEEDDYDEMEYDSIGMGRSSRRRSGFTYKYNDYDDDYDDDDDVIDVRASGLRRRSWEERAMEMDRIPPRAAAWGPGGRVDRDAQTVAAIDAEREIEKVKKYLEKKEDLVDDAKQEVASLKADASFYEKQLETQQQSGRESKVAKRELGYILRDVEDASRLLRMAKAERDAAIKMMDRLKSKHWALLSEYEAVRSFEAD